MAAGYGYVEDRNLCFHTFPTYLGVDTSDLDGTLADRVAEAIHRLVSAVDDPRSSLPQAAMELCRALLIATSDQFTHNGVGYRFGVVDYNDPRRPRYVVLIPTAMWPYVSTDYTPLAQIPRGTLPEYLVEFLWDGGAQVRFFKVG